MEKKQVLVMVPKSYTVVLIGSIFENNNETFIVIYVENEEVKKEIWDAGFILVIDPEKETIIRYEARNPSKIEAYFEFGKSSANIRNIGWNNKPSCGGEKLEVLYKI